MGVSTFNELTPIADPVTLLPANGTVVAAITASRTSGTRIDALLAANSDTIAHIVTLYIQQALVNTSIGTVSLAAGQGTAGTPTVDLLALVLPTTVSGLALPAGATLRISLAVALQAGTTMSLTALGGFLGG